MENKQLPADKYIKALDVDDFDHQLYTGDKIKIYGKETTITGFSAQYNDALGKWETIIYTVGRGDPFERTLSDIEVLEEQPRTYEQRTAQLWHPQPGAVWVKAHNGLIPDGVHSMKLVSKDGLEMRGTGMVKHNTITLITFLNKSTMGIDELPKDYKGVYWLDESATPAAGREEDATDYQQLKARAEKMEKALEIIVNWELPSTGKFWDKDEKEPMSYEAAYGTNSARDYMKNIANEALKGKEASNG